MEDGGELDGDGHPVLDLPCLPPILPEASLVCVASDFSRAWATFRALPASPHYEGSLA
jgi:hypothetical protein